MINSLTLAFSASSRQFLTCAFFTLYVLYLIAWFYIDPLRHHTNIHIISPRLKKTLYLLLIVSVAVVVYCMLTVAHAS